MTYTTHGYPISGTIHLTNPPENLAACGGLAMCAKCAAEAVAARAGSEFFPFETIKYTRTRTFAGYRPQPPEDYTSKGISNGGWQPDYEGVIFSDGTVVIRWVTAFRSHSVWACWKDFYQVHGHPEYGTIIVFDDGTQLKDVGDAEEIPPPPKSS